MTTGIRIRSELSKALIALKGMGAEAIESSTTSLKEELLPQLWGNPAISLDERSYDRGGFRGEREGDEIPPEEQIDQVPPDIAVETGEGGSVDRDLLESGESPFQVAHRRLLQDFGAEDDAEIRGEILRLIEKWRRGEWYPSPFGLAELPPKFREDVAAWFKQILEDLPQLKDSGGSSQTGEPDIIFHINQTEDGPAPYPEINLGFLGRCRLNPSDAGVNQATLKIGRSVKFTPSQLMLLIKAREAALTLLAQFLIEKQSAFIKASDLATAMGRLRSCKQVEFAKFIFNLKSKKDKSRHPKPKEGESFVTRIIKDTTVQVPFNPTPISAKVFFDEFIGRVNVLRTAIELGRSQNYPKLLATDQELILYVLCKGESYDENNIRKKLWPILQAIYFGRELKDSPDHRLKEAAMQLGILGKGGRISPLAMISDAHLATLVNEVKDKLDLQVQVFSENDIRQAREELKVLKDSKKRPKEEEAAKE